jgi:hypothetical protein
MPKTETENPEVTFFELSQATGFRLKGAKSDGKVYIGVTEKQSCYFAMIAGYKRATANFFRSGKTYYFALEIFRELYPREGDLWDQVEAQAKDLK